MTAFAFNSSRLSSAFQNLHNNQLVTEAIVAAPMVTAYVTTAHNSWLPIIEDVLLYGLARVLASIFKKDSNYMKKFPAPALHAHLLALA